MQAFCAWKACHNSCAVESLANRRLLMALSCESICLCAEEYSKPTEDQLSGLGEDDYVMIVFVNKEEAWIYVEHDDDRDKVYGKLCEYPKHIELHKNQRVYFHVSRVAAIKCGYDSD